MDKLRQWVRRALAAVTIDVRIGHTLELRRRSVHVSTFDVWLNGRKVSNQAYRMRVFCVPWLPMWGRVFMYSQNEAGLFYVEPVTKEVAEETRTGLVIWTF